jgi:hypothetical protein
MGLMVGATVLLSISTRPSSRNVVSAADVTVAGKAVHLQDAVETEEMRLGPFGRAIGRVRRHQQDGVRTPLTLKNTQSSLRTRTKQCKRHVDLGAL